MEMDREATVDIGRRYRVACRKADAMDKAGLNLRRLGVALALLLLLGSIIASFEHGVQVLSVGTFLTALVVAPFFALLGDLVTAQGQMLKATLETSVNTSPLLSRDELVRLLSEVSQPSGAGPNRVPCSICDRRVSSTSATIRGDRWYCSKHAPAEAT